jgi:preprotein translocase subunit YajC
MHILLQQNNNTIQILFLLGFIVISFFFFILPTQRKQKKQKDFLNQMKKGDKVVTIGGLHGKITEIDTKTVTLEVDKGFRLVFDKSSISYEATTALESK